MIDVRAGTPIPSIDATVFAALGDARRLDIVVRLCDDGPLPTVAFTAAAHGVSRQGLTKHLRLLEASGLIVSIRVGRHRQWQIRSERIDEMREVLEHIGRQWDARLARLKRSVETDEPSRPGIANVEPRQMDDRPVR